MSTFLLTNTTVHVCEWCNNPKHVFYIGDMMHRLQHSLKYAMRFTTLLQRLQKVADNIIHLVMRRLDAYVGKERIHCFSVVRPVAMTQMQLSRWSGATEIQNNSSLLVIRCTRRVILDFMCCT